MPTGSGPSALPPGLDAQHREVLLGRRADQLGVPGRLIAERHLRSLRALDDVEVGDDVPLVVPHEARAGAARHRVVVHGEEVAAHLDGGDVDHRRARRAGRGRWSPARRRRARWCGGAGSGSGDAAGAISRGPLARRRRAPEQTGVERERDEENEEKGACELQVRRIRRGPDRRGAECHRSTRSIIHQGCR